MAVNGVYFIRRAIQELNATIRSKKFKYILLPRADIKFQPNLAIRLDVYCVT